MGVSGFACQFMSPCWPHVDISLLFSECANHFTFYHKVNIPTGTQSISVYIVTKQGHLFTVLLLVTLNMIETNITQKNGRVISQALHVPDVEKLCVCPRSSNHMDWEPVIGQDNLNESVAPAVCRLSSWQLMGPTVTHRSLSLALSKLNCLQWDNCYHQWKDCSSGSSRWGWISAYQSFYPWMQTLYGPMVWRQGNQHRTSMEAGEPAQNQHRGRGTSTEPGRGRGTSTELGIEAGETAQKQVEAVGFLA